MIGVQSGIDRRPRGPVGKGRFVVSRPQEESHDDLHAQRRGEAIQEADPPREMPSDGIPGPITPQQAIRKRCLDCSDGYKAVENCPFGPDSDVETCTLHQFRMGYARKAGKGSRLKAIRRYCLWCCCGSTKEVRLCPSRDFCALWPYRFGHRPKGER